MYVQYADHTAEEKEQDMYEYDYGVFIGRFQPLHKGHVAVIEKALTKVEKLIVLIGSSNFNRRVRNPFTFDERKNMFTFVDSISKAIADKRIIILPLEDKMYQNQAWLRQAQDIVFDVTNEDGWRDKPKKIALVGSQKDGTGFYLNQFPQFSSVPVVHVIPLNASDIRLSMYEQHHAHTQYNRNPEDMMPIKVALYVNSLMREDWFTEVRQEWEWSEAQKLLWANAPYTPTFNTVDAVVIQNGYVLMVKRGNMPGRGKWALPGGYIGEHETIMDAMIRELREETDIDCTDNYLMANHKGVQEFDDPHRSSRGRIFTRVGLFVLPNGKLPRVRIGNNKDEDPDEIMEVRFRPLSRITPQDTFEDHGFILQKLVGNI